jgi:hypothetical protein
MIPSSLWLPEEPDDLEDHARMVVMAGLIMLSVVVTVLLTFVWAMNSRRAGERGWVYNRYNPRPRGVGTLGILESIYQPTIEHVIEERSSERARGSQDTSGDPPEAGRAERPE